MSNEVEQASSDPAWDLPRKRASELASWLLANGWERVRIPEGDAEDLIGFMRRWFDAGDRPPAEREEG